MKRFLPLLLLIFSCSPNADQSNKRIPTSDTTPIQHTVDKDISDPTNTLTGKTETLELSYIVWGCDCANWVTPADFDKYKDAELNEHCIFIEPATDSLSLKVPSYFDPFKHKIKIKGQFYKNPDYPKGTVQSEERLEKAKVFRYTELKVKEKAIDYLVKNDQTLILNYNAISCSCPQWSETKYNNQPDKREYYYLESADSKLINADTLWQGNNIPLQIQVTGQITTEAGYPTGYKPTKEKSEAGKVFRYTKLKVLQSGQKKLSTD